MGYRRWLTLAGVLVSATVLAAGSLSARAQKGGTLRLGSEGDVDSVDPALAYTGDSWWLEYATCAKLYNYPDKPAPEGVVATPEVAASFPRLSDHGRTQTIRLKRTYRFQTGAPVTAANFVAAFNRDANPAIRSPVGPTGYLNDIVGAGAALAGKRQQIAGVKALGPYTLQIRTTHPVNDLPARLTMPFFCPIAPGSPAREDQHPLGSGPYYLASRVPNRAMVLERNPYYRGSRPANVARIVWTIGVGNEACRQAVVRDELDYCVTRTFGPAGDRALAAKFGINRRNGQYFFRPLLQTAYFAFNHDRQAFAGRGQIPLKQAINWAIDRRAMVGAVSFLGGQRTDQILPPALARPAHIYSVGGVTSASLTKARRLLAKAKLRPAKLVLYAPSDGFFPVWARLFQFDLKRLGIDVEVKYFPFDVLDERAGVRGAPFDVVAYGWLPDYADGFTYFGPLLDGANLTKNGNQNFAYFDRPGYNRAIDRISALNGDRRRRAWADLDVDMMRRDPPWAPVMNNSSRELVSKSVGCYVFQPAIGRLDLGAACKK